MPYIPKEDRRHAVWSKPRTPGELNYAIHVIVEQYLQQRAIVVPCGRNDYIDFNDVLGALEAAKLELYRRMIAPYEDKKAAQNGDLEMYVRNK